MESINLYENTVDKSQVPAIEQKRLVAFVNHFLINTVNFLNKFARNCEERFIEFETKLQRINADLTIVESIVLRGELKNQSTISDIEPISDENVTEITTQSEDVVDQSTEVIESDQIAANQPDNEEAAGVKVSDDIRYRKYFKMIQFGVPAEAVKLKMISEGLDGSLIHEPNKILTDGIPYQPEKNFDIK